MLRAITLDYYGASARIAGFQAYRQNLITSQNISARTASPRNSHIMEDAIVDSSFAAPSAVIAQALEEAQQALRTAAEKEKQTNQERAQLQADREKLESERKTFEEERYACACC